MSTLLLVSRDVWNSKWSHDYRRITGEVEPHTLSSLVERILREQNVPFRQDAVAETVALWESVWRLANELQAFAPIHTFPGFLAELRSLVRRLAHRESLLGRVGEQEAKELQSIFLFYRHWLESRQIWDEPLRIEAALDYWPHSAWARRVKRVEIHQLSDLSPLEEELVHSLCQGKPVVKREPATVTSDITRMSAPNPQQEVEFVARELAAQIRAGKRPGQLMVAVSHLETYLPLLMPTLQAWDIPWSRPPLRLIHTPLGKAVSALITGAANGWHKTHLQQVVVSGWGFPFPLTSAERRSLKEMPAVRGLGPMSKYLATPGWRRLLRQLKQWGAALTKGTLLHYGQTISEIIQEFPPPQWGSDEGSWATHLQACQAFTSLCQALTKGRQTVGLNQFAALFSSLLREYQLPITRSFHEQIVVTTFGDTCNRHYDTIYVVGLCEGTIPAASSTHWLTRERQGSDHIRWLDKLLMAGARVVLSYPEADQDGQENLPSPYLTNHTQNDDVHRLQRASRVITMAGSHDSHTPPLMATEMRTQLRLYVLEQELSASRLNIYARCPYQFFCSEILQLETLEVLAEEPTAVEEGQYVHRILQRFWEHKGMVDVGEIAYRVYHEANLTPSPRVLHMVNRFVKRDVKQVEKSGFVPTYLEYSFRSLVVPTDYGDCRLQGVIDRVDVASDGRYVLYDYKFGQAPRTTDVLEGRQLQIAIYLLAARAQIPGHPSGAAFYSVKDGQRRGVWVDEDRKTLGVRKNKGCFPQDQWSEVIEHLTRQVQHCLQQIMDGCFPAEPYSDLVCGYCPYNAICRREI